MKQINITNLNIKEFTIIPDGTDFIMTSSYALISDTGIEMPAIRKSTKWKDLSSEQKDFINGEIKKCKTFSDLINVTILYLKTVEQI